MDNEKFVNCIIKGHTLYWDLLGNMRGNNNHKSDICWLSGDISFTYSIHLNGSAYRNQFDRIVHRIENKEVPNNITVCPDSADQGIDLIGYINKTGLFRRSFTSLGMAKELNIDTTFPKADKRLNIFRVNNLCELKMCGAILNTVFEYDLFSFEHYLDAFNTQEVTFHIAEYNGLPIGACMSITKDDILEIAWVGTLNGYRKKGIAASLIHAAEKDAVQKGVSVAVLTASEGAINAYKRIGYQGYCSFEVFDFIGRENEK
ncbi:MAG: GNAT family N-acetyltransferase [Thermoclostridium sp.]|nr:GNAT family N-acetyltransferase [Thermoclostridium sp.]